jgi:hypothetical protein
VKGLSDSEFIVQDVCAVNVCDLRECCDLYPDSAAVNQGQVGSDGYVFGCK